jgi:predicted Zn finger-like uncharacterized protein
MRISSAFLWLAPFSIRYNSLRTIRPCAHCVPEELSMAIAFACPGCATPFNVTDDMAGKRAKCPKCQMVFTLPAATPPPPPAVPVATDLFPPPPNRNDERRSSRSAKRDEEDERDPDRDRDRDYDEPRPRRSRIRRKSGSSLPLILGIGAAVVALMLLCGGAITILAIIGLSNRDNPPPRPPVIANINAPAIQVGPGGQVQLKQGSGTQIQLQNGRFSINTQLTVQDPFDPDTKEHRCKLYLVTLQQGRTYTIDMVSPNTNQLDPMLRVEDLNENVLQQNDDIQPGVNLNARLAFTPNMTGSYVIVATSFEPQQHGPFTLTIRENGK